MTADLGASQLLYEAIDVNVEKIRRRQSALAYTTFKPILDRKCVAPFHSVSSIIVLKSQIIYNVGLFFIFIEFWEQ